VGLEQIRACYWHMAADFSNVAVFVDGLLAFINFALLKVHACFTNDALRKPAFVEHNACPPWEKERPTPAAPPGLALSSIALWKKVRVPRGGAGASLLSE
jgi:hypothetical protein